MTNTNCLENIQCPACGNEESFRIAATTMLTVTDDGTDDYSDTEWDNDSYIECTACHRHGSLKDFASGVSASGPAQADTIREPKPPGASQVELSEDEFGDRYPLVPNHLNPSASWGTDNQRGCLFETYGEELEFVRRQDPHTVWTLVDGDDGGQRVINGFHLVNRIGYLISAVAVPEGIDVDVRITKESPSASAHAPALLLDLVRYGLLSLSDGDAEFDGVMYWFDDQRPDWLALIDAIGWDSARAAIAQATTDERTPL
jgi:hypothetical protein